MYRFLFGSLFLAGLGWMATLYYLKEKEKRWQDPQYNIVALVQSCPQQESLKTGYLAELLHLSADLPSNLYAFDLEEGERRLLRSPLIKAAVLKRIPPGTLYVHYQVRTPLAYIGELTNTAVDEEGVLFPFTPFFTPKKLPKLWFGFELDRLKWGNHIDREQAFQLVTEILKQIKSIENSSLAVRQIDVSHAFSSNRGKREIVLKVETRVNQEEARSVYLRLDPHSYLQNLADWQTLQKRKLKPEFEIVDLRVPHMGLVK